MHRDTVHFLALEVVELFALSGVPCSIIAAFGILSDLSCTTEAAIIACIMVYTDF